MGDVFELFGDGWFLLYGCKVDFVNIVGKCMLFVYLNYQFNVIVEVVDGVFFMLDEVVLVYGDIVFELVMWFVVLVVVLMFLVVDL